MSASTRTPSRTQRIIRLLVYAAILATALALIGEATVAATNWLISNADPDVSPSDLTGRGKVGQTFNAANALFSGLALLAVATTVLLQRRELRMQREELSHLRQYNSRSSHDGHRAAEASIRANHFALIRLAIENPSLAEVWPPFAADRSLTAEESTQFHYANLILSHAWLGLCTAQLTESEIRAELKHYLKSPVMQSFWRSVRRGRLARPISPEAEIDRLMDEEYQRLPHNWRKPPMAS